MKAARTRGGNGTKGKMPLEARELGKRSKRVGRREIASGGKEKEKVEESGKLFSGCDDV